MTNEHNIKYLCKTHESETMRYERYTSHISNGGINACLYKLLIVGIHQMNKENVFTTYTVILELKKNSNNSAEGKKTFALYILPSRKFLNCDFLLP